MNVKSIVRSFLQAHGYDGLYNQAGEESCGCPLDDFIPCHGEGIESCVPGYLGADGNMYLTREDADECES